MKRLDDMVRMIGKFYILFITCTVLWVSVLFIFQVRVGRQDLIMGYLTALAIVWFLGGKNDKKGYGLSMLVATLLFIGWIGLSSCIYEIAYDGNMYHKFAVGILKMGWNPLYEDVWRYIGQLGIPQDKLSSSDLWVSCYPKASWYFEAAVYSWTKDIESSKVVNILLAIGTYSIVYDYFRYKLKIAGAAILSFLFIYIPAMVSQLFTFYVDGILGNLLFCIICILLSLSDPACNKDVRIRLLYLGCCIILCGNLKITGLCYAGVFCFGFFVYWMFLLRRQKTLFLKRITALFLYYMAVAGITVVVVGAGTYLTNLMHYGNPLYPIFGSSDINVNNSLKTVSLDQASPFRQMISMIFVRTNSNDSIERLQWKLPFSVDKSEIISSSHDVIRGGAGVFFSGILLLSFVLLVVFLWKLWNKDRQLACSCIMVLGLSFFLICFMPVGGQARYSPYIYLFPLLAIYVYEYYVERYCGSGVRVHLAGILLMVFMFANSGIFGEYIVRGIVETADYRKHYQKMAEADYIEMDTKLPGLVFNLKDKGIDYRYLSGQEDKAYNMKYYYLFYNMVNDGDYAEGRFYD